MSSSRRAGNDAAPRGFTLWPSEGSECARAQRAHVAEVLHAAIDELPANVPWSVRIEPYVHKADSRQKARFHALVGELARKMGDDPRSVKEWAKLELGETATVRGPDGRDVEIAKSTNDYSGDELDALCERVTARAAEYGYVLGERKHPR